MKHRVTGSIDLNTEGIAEAVYDRLAPLLQPRPAGLLLDSEQLVDILTEMISAVEALRASPYSDRTLAAALAGALLAAGYTLMPIPPAAESVPAIMRKPGFWGRHTD